MDELQTPSDSGAAGSAAFAVDPRLRERSIALVGLMGVGKSTVGRRLAQAVGLPFHDLDAEIEKAAGRSVSDIFAELGEPEFRAGEHRVLRRLISGRPKVLATGGGAYLNAETRALLKEKAVTVWLRAELPVLARRVSRKDTRPLIRDRDPMQVLSAQAEARYPVYAEADVVVDVSDGSHKQATRAVLVALSGWLEGADR